MSDGGDVSYRMRWFAMTLMACAWLPAAEWYVSTTGSDGNAGTSPAAAFASLAKATDTVRPGDTVWVASGSYAATRLASLWEKAGTAALPILISGMPGQARPVIDCSSFAGSANNAGIYMGGSVRPTTCVTIRRLCIRNAGSHGILAQAASDITIEDCEIAGSQFNAVHSYAPRTVVRFNWLHDNCIFNDPPVDDGNQWGQGIGVPGGDDSVIEGNIVERNFGEGIGVYGSAERVRVTANAVIDVYSIALYLSRARHTVVERNFVRLADAAFFRSGYPAMALGQADEDYADRPDLASIGNVWRNNVAIGCGSGFSYGAYTGDGSVPIGLRDTLVLHNTLAGAQRPAIAAGTAAGHSGNRFAGNLLRQAAGYTFSYIQGQNDYVPVPGVLEFDHNAWWDSASVLHGAIGSARITSDPQLADAAGTTPWSQAPTAASPLLTASTALAEVTDDFQGRPRPIGSGPEIGAFERGAADVNEVELALPAGAIAAERVFTVWDWGDGTPAYATVGLASGHRYAAAGAYTLSTTVHDPEHATATTAMRTVTASSSPVLVTMASADAQAAEHGQDPAAFTVSRSGSTASSLVVAYTVAGSATPGIDYQTLPGVVTIPAGAASATIAVVPLADAIADGDETVVVTLGGGASYAVGSPASVALAIADDTSGSGGAATTSSASAGGGCGAGLSGVILLALLALCRCGRACGRGC